MPARKTPSRQPAAAKRPRGRRPGPTSSREEVLGAARAAFAEHGFGGATIRDIARRAGVDPALPAHLFGSKDALFAAALELPFDSTTIVGELLAGPRRDLGRRMVATFVRLWDDPEVGGRMLAIIRSAATHEAAADRLRELVETQILGPVAAALGVPDARVRAGLAGAQLVGIGFTRYVVRLEPLVSADPETIERLAGPAVQRYLTGRL